MELIPNKIVESALEVFDLEDYYQAGPRFELDISQWFTNGFLLREKEFRQQLKDFDFSIYQNAFVAVFCATDAIVPAWASVLVTMHLAPFARKIVSGRLEDLENVLYAEILSTINFEAYANKAVILKGCSRKPVPNGAYVLAAQNLQRVSRSIMYGEACSAVPLFKRR